MFGTAHNVKLLASDKSPVEGVPWLDVWPCLEDVAAHVEKGGLFGSVPNSFVLSDGLYLSALDVDRGDASKLAAAYPALASVPSWQPGRMHCYYPDKVARPNSTWSFGDVGGEVRSANGYLAHYRTGPLELATAISRWPNGARCVPFPANPGADPHEPGAAPGRCSSTGPRLRLPDWAEGHSPGSATSLADTGTRRLSGPRVDGRAARRGTDAHSTTLGWFSICGGSLSVCATDCLTTRWRALWAGQCPCGRSSRPCRTAQRGAHSKPGEDGPAAWRAKAAGVRASGPAKRRGTARTELHAPSVNKPMVVGGGRPLKAVGQVGGSRGKGGNTFTHFPQLEKQA